MCQMVGIIGRLLALVLWLIPYVVRPFRVAQAGLKPRITLLISFRTRFESY